MQFAHIELRHGTPVATLFNDVYFSHQDGLDESRYVYLQHNDLPARFAQSTDDYITVGEVGFGTGLNFLATWQAWRAHRPDPESTGRLHFISTEKYPVHPDQLPLLLLPFRDQLPVVDELLALYSQLTPGWNRFSFRDAELTLYLGDATAGLHDCVASVDAWYLDGFAPAKNPDLWHAGLYAAMARLSHPGTTLASFTAVSSVRHGLRAAGFAVQRRPGYGRKWHLTRGRFVGLMGPMPFDRQRFWWPRPTATKPGRVAVIGTGLAAAELAPRLQRRGFDVTLIAPTPPGQAASGNTQGAVYAKPGLEADPATCFYAQALSYRLRHWAANSQQTPNTPWPGKQTGLLQLLTPDRWARMNQTLDRQPVIHPFAQLLTPVTAERASELAGVTLSQPALWFAASGWLSPTEYCQQALRDVKQIHSTAEALSYNGTMLTWLVTDGESRCHEFDTVVIAAGHTSAQWSQSEWLPIKPVRGQVSTVTMDGAPDTVICGQHYVTPVDTHGAWSFGASFDVHADHSDVTEADRQHNRAGLATLSTDLADAIQQASSVDRAGVRATTPDYLPLAGPLLSDATRQRDPRHCFQPWRAVYQPNLYVLTGLGSKGLVSAPLLAEYVTCQITGEPLPFGRDTEQRIHAGRRWLRQGLKGGLTP